jgi:hypothetical protein
MNRKSLEEQARILSERRGEEFKIVPKGKRIYELQNEQNETPFHRGDANKVSLEMSRMIDRDLDGEMDVTI